MKMNKKNIKGFTLIEVMIVVAILGIISVIAVPSYVESVRKGKRADAKVELLRLAQMQESYFVQNLSYARDLTSTQANGGLGLGATVESEQGEYTMQLTSNPSNCDGTAAAACTSFTLKATPTGAQISDIGCASFTLTNTGRKGVSAGYEQDRIKKCWK